jgi:hypothetical protein
MSNDCADQKEKETAYLKERVERAEKFLEYLLAQADSYHNHKESMAYAGLLVMLAICGGVLSLDGWPPEWVPCGAFGLSRHLLTLIGVGVLWFIVHLYIRWQFRHRRGAAITYNGALAGLVKWIKDDPAERDLVPSRTQKPCCLAKILDSLFPFHKGTPNMLVERTDFPVWLVDGIRQEAKGIGCILDECLAMIGSIFAFAIIIVRTYPDWFMRFVNRVLGL